MRKIHIGKLIIALLIPLLVGVISAAISSKGMALYATINKPPLSPPAIVFPIAWTALYLMMGLASYFIFTADIGKPGRGASLTLYIIQLAMNFMWPIVFFNWTLYLFAFIWLIIMWFIVIICIFIFHKVHKAAAWLMTPYIAWLTFAAYLNIGVFWLNKG